MRAALVTQGSVCHLRRVPALNGKRPQRIAEALRHGSNEPLNLDQDRGDHEGSSQDGREASGCKLNDAHFGSPSVRGTYPAGKTWCGIIVSQLQR
jgi:hypothetical protein